MRKSTLTIALLTLFMIGHSQDIKSIILKGNLKKAEKWLDSGRDLDQLLESTTTSDITFQLHPLELAAAQQQNDIVKLFLNNSDKFKDINRYYHAAFVPAIITKDFELLQLALDKGADLSANCKICHDAPILAIAVTYENFEAFNLLLEKGAPLESDGAGYDVLFAAAGFDSVPFLRYLVEEKKLNVGTINKFGTPLTNAFGQGLLDNARYLISQGADPAQKDLDGHSILYHASTYETFKYAEDLLLKRKLPLDPPEAWKMISYDDKKLFDYYFLRYPFMFAIKDKNGFDAFLGVVYSESNDNAEYFIKSLKQLGYRPTTDIEGYTAYDHAKYNKNKRIVYLFKYHFGF
jgi:ankyrin repeat protein